MYYPIDDFAGPGTFVLQDADRFRAILHSGEIPLADGTKLILAIFVVRRDSGTYDQFIVNKFFRPDGSVSRSLMSKKDIAAADIEQTLATTAKTFASASSQFIGRVEVFEADAGTFGAKLPVRSNVAGVALVRPDGQDALQLVA